MNKEQDQRKHDQLITWASVMFIVTLIIGFSINVNAQSSQQSGTACVNGSQYCENNSLDTTNNTTTNNTNSNTNNNTNTSTSTATNTNNNTNTNVSTNTNNSTNTNSNTNVSTNSNTNVNTSTSNNTNTNNNVNTSTSNSTVNSTVNQNVNNTNNSTSNNTNTNTNINKSESKSDVSTNNVNQNNNSFTLVQPVVNSYDPNDATILEGAQITAQQATQDLHFRIRFQNTGTDTAFNVVITDQLDENLDWYKQVDFICRQDVETLKGWWESYEMQDILEHNKMHFWSTYQAINKQFLYDLAPNSISTICTIVKYFDHKSYGKKGYI